MYTIGQYFLAINPEHLDNISILRYIDCLHEIEIQTFTKYGYLIERKSRWDTK